ncbi:hypothetical protein P8452_73678 [Trifolium repens]|nr:hypothetical protein P8452_73678 [Trifolium repens]
MELEFLCNLTELFQKIIKTPFPVSFCRFPLHKFFSRLQRAKSILLFRLYSLSPPKDSFLSSFLLDGDLIPPFILLSAQNLLSIAVEIFVYMEIDDNEVCLSSPSKGLNDLANTVEERIPTCDDEFKPVIGNLFDTLEEGGDFYKRVILYHG